MKTSVLSRTDSAPKTRDYADIVDSRKNLGSKPARPRPIGEISHYAAGTKKLPTDSLTTQPKGAAKPQNKPIGVTLQVTPSWLNDHVSVRMGALAQKRPGATDRGAGLMLPRLGAEVPLLTKIDQDILPLFELLPRRGEEATCAAQMLASRDRMTGLFVQHAYTALAHEAKSLAVLAVSPHMALTVRTLRLEILLMARHRRAQMAQAAGRQVPGAQQGARLKTLALEALENSLVALVVRPA